MDKNQSNQSEEQKICFQIHKNMQEKGARPSFRNIEDKLAYLILEQRYRNLWEFIQRQDKKYGGIDSQELLELWFLYNDLEEVHFIGTDVYADAMFVKHKVSYLYRSVGRDSESLVSVERDEEDEIGQAIFRECLEQIKSGGKGKLYSYSKCFGKMLYKYANIRNGINGKTVIEIRKDAYVNAVSEDGDNSHIKTLQRFMRGTEEALKDKTGEAFTEASEKNSLFFAVDMSNARGNRVDNLKLWLDGFLGKQEYTKRFSDIYDPIGDAEVVSNFTGCSSGESVFCSGVERFVLNQNEFCVLLYQYFSRFADCLGEARRNGFDEFIARSMKTMSEREDDRYKEFYALYQSVLNDSAAALDRDKLRNIMENIDWNQEKIYMGRVKAEKGDNGRAVSCMDIYKEEESEAMGTVWKKILFLAVEGRYGYIDFSGR